MIQIKNIKKTFMTNIKKIGIGLSVIIIAIIAIVVVFHYSKHDAVDVINEQLMALRANDIEKAYTYTSKDFQIATSHNDFVRFIDRNPILKTNVKAEFPNREVNENIALISGSLFESNGSATPVEYHMIKEDNDWKVLQLAINPVIGATTSQVATVNSTALTKKYDNKESRFSIQYPDSWEYDAEKAGTVVFSGKPGHPSYYSTVNIQTILTKKNGGEYANIKEFIADIKKQAYSQSKNVKILNTGPFVLTAADGTKAKGQFLIFTYVYQNQAFKQWQIVILRNDEQVFYAWGYTSPIDEYQNDLATAQEMLKTWVIY